MATTEFSTTEESFRLREYLAVLRARKWSVFVLTLLGLGAALFYAQTQTPQFRSDSRVLATNPLAFLTANAPPNMETERALVGSTQVTLCASQLLEDPTGDPAELCAPAALERVEVQPGLRRGLQVTVEQNTTILSIGYVSPSPRDAQTRAQAFAEAYIHIKLAEANARLDLLRQDPLRRQDDLSQQAEDLGNQIDDAIDAEQQYVLLLNQLQVTNQQLFQVVAELAATSPSKISLPFLAQEAGLPAAPFAPNKPLIAIVGLFVGLAFGIGLALLRERLDDRLHGRSDLESQLGAPVLAVIPKVPGWRRREDSKLTTLEEPKSAVAEAYRTLRTSILFTALQRGIKTVMVCSPTAGEGKTTTACNLAVSLADAGKRVVLLSADLRKPRLHRFFGLENTKGLSNVLAGEIKPWEALQDPKVPNLRVMASGPVPARPAELLQSEQMGELLAELRGVADIVILDTAPVLLVADALGLAPLVDGVLFVADSESTSGSAVVQARQQMEQVSAPMIGAVYNNFDPTKARGYGYGYGYGGYRYRYGGYQYTYGGEHREAASDGGGRRKRQETPSGLE